MKKITVDVVSDVMCPWCYIGKTNLDAAVEQLTDMDVEIHWRPYQLDATLPKSGKDRATYLNEKFGGEERAREIYKRIEDAGKDLGLDFNFEAIAVSPNTMDAHRLIRWAGGMGGDVQDKLVTRLFEVFFIEGGNIGDDDVLIEAAKAAGMDGTIVRDLLKTEDDKQAVSQEIDHARNMGITGVPCFIIDQKYAVMGAQPPEAIVQAIRQAASEEASAR